MLVRVIVALATTLQCNLRLITYCAKKVNFVYFISFDFKENNVAKKLLYKS